MAATVSVIMLYRDNGDADRGRAHRYCRDWWVYEVGWPVYVLDVPGPLWSRPGAFNLGAKIAPEGVIVQTNSDVILGSPQQAQDAARLAERSGVTVYPWRRYVELGTAGSERVHAGGDWGESDVALQMMNSVGPMLMIRSDCYHAAGGFDPRFNGGDSTTSRGPRKARLSSARASAATVTASTSTTRPTRRRTPTPTIRTTKPTKRSALATPGRAATRR